MTEVLYNVGKGRSGSTLLDLAVGQLDGCFAAGELLLIWANGVIGGHSCGCGRPVPQCPFWNEVFDTGFGGLETMDPSPAELAELQRDLSRWSRLPMLASPLPTFPGHRALRRWSEATGRLYEAIGRVSGASVIVESWVTPANPGVWGRVEGVDRYVLHRVRDPRAVAYSWRRRKALPDRGPSAEMERHATLQTVASWNARNAVAEVARRRVDADRSLRVRYEDFVEEPRDVLDEIAAMLGLPAPGRTVLDDGVLSIRENHTVGGNPMRFAGSSVPLRLDDAWTAGQRNLTNGVVAALTSPLRRRYGYAETRGLRVEDTPS